MLDNVARELFLISVCSPVKFENMKSFLVKMWKYISGVPKVVGEKKKKIWKLPVIQKSTRRTGQGSFQQNGKLAGRGYSMITIWYKGMICEWCIENKQT